MGCNFFSSHQFISWRAKILVSSYQQKNTLTMQYFINGKKNILTLVCHESMTHFAGSIETCLWCQHRRIWQKYLRLIKSYFVIQLFTFSFQKPYACSVPGCNKRYTDPSSLRKHVKNHNQKDPQLKKKVHFNTSLFVFVSYFLIINLYLPCKKPINYPVLFPVLLMLWLLNTCTQI